MDLTHLSPEARLAHMSLEDHPELTTPDAIANGPYGIQEVTTSEITHGLKELEAAGLAVQTVAGWSIVKA